MKKNWYAGEVKPVRAGRYTAAAAAAEAAPRHDLHKKEKNIFVTE